MKRKAIHDLLQTTEQNEASEKIASLIPDGLPADKTTAAARLVLESAVAKSRQLNMLDPTEFYSVVCLDSPASLAVFLKETEAKAINQVRLKAAQSLLKEVLTSKAGRKKTSELSRAEQLAAAQARRREKSKEQGRKQLNVWISPEAADYLDIIKATVPCDTQAQALELVLDAAMKSGLLTPTK